MPDGVTIRAGLGFAGSPQPPDVPCDPAGEAWRGPPVRSGLPGPATPGPPGPPGADSTFQAPLVRPEPPDPRGRRAFLAHQHVAQHRRLQAQWVTGAVVANDTVWLAYDAP